MSENNLNYRLNRLWSARDSNGATLQLGVYAGVASFAIFKKGNNKPELKVNMPDCYVMGMKECIKNVLSSNPGVGCPFITTTWDNTAKKRVKDTTFTFTRMDDKSIVLEIVNPRSDTFKFTLYPSAQYSFGDPMNADMRATIGAKELLYVLDKKLPSACMLSTFNLPPMPRRDGSRPDNNSGNNYNKQKPSDDPFAGSDSGDIF
jgi:hypothetical protein